MIYKNIEIHNAAELISCEDGGRYLMGLISADGVHPSIYGVAQIGNRLYDRIKGLVK